MKPIPFSPPDITKEEIQAVSDVLRSGWITTGPKVKEFETNISQKLGGGKTLCLNSATAGLELSLRLCNIKAGDEVITTPYTFAATANVILHLGAKPIFADLPPNSFHLSANTIASKLTSHTRAILTVDYAGFPVDFPAIQEMLQSLPDKQRPVWISDSAHSFGATVNGKSAASFADFSVFSFHAVKNLTTAEGGALFVPPKSPFFAEKDFNTLKQMSMHGMTKDAFSKEVLGDWAYDITLAGYKYNMTDIQAAIGLIQLKRYDHLLEKRKSLFDFYKILLQNDSRILLPPFDTLQTKLHEFFGSAHLFPVRILQADEHKRNKIMQALRQIGIATNVHYRPLPLFQLYRKLGYRMEDYPNAFAMYENEITLPLYTLLEQKQQQYIAEQLIKILKE